jgi:hypothetical protein
LHQLIIVSASSKRATTGFTIASLVLYVVFAIAGAAMSKFVRRKLFQSVRAEYQGHLANLSSSRAKGSDDLQAEAREQKTKTKELALQLEDDNDSRRSHIWNILLEEYIPGTTRSVREWYKAVQVCC